MLTLIYANTITIKIINETEGTGRIGAAPENVHIIVAYFLGINSEKSYLTNKENEKGLFIIIL